MHTPPRGRPSVAASFVLCCESRPITSGNRRVIANAGAAMKTSEVLRAWSTILAGRSPSMSIEITKECPLRCPGCYAFDSAHLGGAIQLRQLSDFKGDGLVTSVL